ncbi:MAG: DUF192 domain-containing protein [Candidatus Aenigmatarchaeota archaeon]
MTTVRRKGKKLIIAEDAHGIIGKAVGLMGRRSLDKNKGMLFRFPFEHNWSMWMFGMRFPLDFIFVDKNMMVVHIEKTAKPFSSDPKTWKTVSSPEKFRYVIEINAGEAVRKRIKAGDVLSF